MATTAHQSSSSNNSNMEKFLRSWRQDAMNKAQYDSAIFIGDKLLAMTKDDNDAFFLAQVHFAAGNHTRAHSLLSRHSLINRNPACRYLAAHCLIKQGLYSEALSLLGEHSPRHLFSRTGGEEGPRRKTSRTAGNNTTTKAGGDGKVKSRLRIHDGQQEEEEEEEEDEGRTTRKYEAAMCHLRGLCFAKQNAFDRAKEAYKDALRIDVQCYEAFSQLVKNNLMSPDEEDEFMSLLDFGSVGSERGEEEPGDYTHMLYQTQLSKYRHPMAFNTAVESLTTHYGLEGNADIMLARADQLYTQCRFKDALAVTERVLEGDRFNFGVYPIHLACLYELKRTNVLFLIAHELADSYPEEPASWLAVGIYYFATGKIAEARRYFSKASMMDPNFGPAWIGFAHTFAAEGEHDQAVTAYSTAARLFTGTHLPQVFLGMQNHAMNNMTAAEEFLRTGYGLCREDPLLLNEMGIVCYHQDRAKEAAAFFREALRVAEETESESGAWLGARTNLGHAYRRLKMWEEALGEFDAVLREGGRDAGVFAAKGLIYLDLGRAGDAVEVLHEALGIWPQDPIATELLSKALEMSMEGGLGLGGEGGLVVPGEEGEVVVEDGKAGEGNEEMDRFEEVVEQRKKAARERVAGRGRKGGSLDKGKGIAGRGGGMRTGLARGQGPWNAGDMDMSEEE
ncbi:anaphase-promoting complex subunit Cut9 [Podospora bellae-mahoneyi]|uniref:Anaphase-promoting complex subunit Cut9 n=1 Tax=Podospora bellae-mahoneyi TaxID=2093777 RepID=A0ABR0FQJ6_9PEZI|nr:anaphase-promoting complex subunit Cut9 [Podospora bellae-mahoneyi]